MSATNGSLRSRSRLISLALVAVFAICAMSATAASATPTKETTLTLGDSLAFGYSQQLLNENLLTGDPATAFEHGYANYYQIMHHYKAEGSQLANLGCPGETTDSMIGNNQLGSTLDPSTGEAPCAYHNVNHLPLHVEYGQTSEVTPKPASQLEVALKELGENAVKGTPVTKVTLNIGANDQLHAIGKCEAEVKHEYETEGKSKYGATPESAVKGCIESHVPALFEHILHNIGSILFTLRHGSLFGSVDYSGPIIVQGGYDPYGRVYKTQEEVETAKAAGPQFNKAKTGELLTGSNGLAALLNYHENKLVTDEGTEAAEEGHEAFHACYANPQPTFNPAKGEEGIRGSLQKFTNMNNQTVQTYPPATGVGPRPNGPDIHPTPAGYKKLAQIMTAACG